MLLSDPVRVLVDYRPALSQRSGVGEYIHELVAAYVGLFGDRDEVVLFSSSLRDRLTERTLPPRTRRFDRRIPVQLLNRLWHRWEWPSVERLVGESFDLLHSPHPLLLPARSGARVVTIHDLDFLDHPERTREEVRRDYARLAPRHAERADHVIVNSAYTAGEVHQRFGVPRGQLTVCRPGAPAWTPRRSIPQGGPILFVGTLEARKNVGTLLDAYARLLSRRPDAPELLLAGRAVESATPWLRALSRPPLAGRARHLGYVSNETRMDLYNRAAMLVLPSFDEGFGLPVLEAMTMGVPVVASNRGALPEVLGDAGLLISPTDPAGLAHALDRLLSEPGLRETFAARGLRRSRLFDWHDSARSLRGAYEEARETARRRRAGRGRGM